MYEQIEKPQEKKSRSVAKSIGSKPSSGVYSSKFVDNRPDVFAQRKLQEKMNNSLQGKHGSQLQSIADNHSFQQQSPIQNKEATAYKPVQKATLESAAQQHPKPQTKLIEPLQLMTFKRFRWKQNPLNWGWKYNTTEKNLLAVEKKLKEALDELKPFTNGMLGADILQIAGKFHFITSGDYEATEYATVLKKMTDLVQPIDELKEQALSANLDDNHVNAALTTNQGNGPIAKEVMIELLKVYAALPTAMNSAKNKKLIAEAIYPDLRAASGFYNEDMGASTAKFAKTRGALLTKNFKQLHDRIVGTWDSIKHTFNIDGDLNEIELTGSDFHNEGQQVAIVESTTGKKIVYKPRSVSPDANLTGGGSSAFDDLNKLSRGTCNCPL
jgi:hypothetical protein